MKQARGREGRLAPALLQALVTPDAGASHPSRPRACVTHHVSRLSVQGVPPRSASVRLCLPLFLYGSEVETQAGRDSHRWLGFHTPGYHRSRTSHPSRHSVHTRWAPLAIDRFSVGCAGSRQTPKTIPSYQHHNGPGRAKSQERTETDSRAFRRYEIEGERRSR